jgi:hypothetical protein
MGKLKCPSCNVWKCSPETVWGRKGTFWENRKICIRCDNPSMRAQLLTPIDEQMDWGMDFSEQDSSGQDFIPVNIFSFHLFQIFKHCILRKGNMKVQWHIILEICQGDQDLLFLDFQWTCHKLLSFWFTAQCHRFLNFIKFFAHSKVMVWFRCQFLFHLNIQ